MFTTETSDANDGGPTTRRAGTSMSTREATTAQESTMPAMQDVVPFLAHQTGAELIVKVGATAQVHTFIDDGCPILQVTWGSITLLLMPHSASEDVPIVACDVERARDLDRAAGQYRQAMEQLWAAQEAAAAQVTSGSWSPVASAGNDRGEWDHEANAGVHCGAALSGIRDRHEGCPR